MKHTNQCIADALTEDQNPTNVLAVSAKFCLWSTSAAMHSFIALVHKAFVCRMYDLRCTQILSKTTYVAVIGFSGIVRSVLFEQHNTFN